MSLQSTSGALRTPTILRQYSRGDFDARLRCLYSDRSKEVGPGRLVVGRGNEGEKRKERSLKYRHIYNEGLTFWNQIILNGTACYKLILTCFMSANKWLLLDRCYIPG